LAILLMVTIYAKVILIGYIVDGRRCHLY
jgi:hypothetical protein